ncbi:hypothetical protein DPEC_G00141090 [Dallia pectoralis]|uniref:Uncharacterized protein n=1 Tax=Dallia pectoralis TaxID=75939 RepID=A0ACC2GN92_DALPE|nr:hypothetical protein DPEC_G00141090 [Dallia pectoralis]
MAGTQGFLAMFTIAVCFLLSGAQETVCNKEMIADIVFLVDGSGSIGQMNFQQIRQFLFTLVDSFDVAPDKVRIGLVQYSTRPRTEFLLNTFSEKQNILDYINRLPYKDGGTMTGEGLDFLLKELFVDRAGSRINDNVPQIAVVITDGKSQDNVQLHALELQKRGITLYAIGIGYGADKKQLKEIATKPDNQHLFSVSGFEALQGISQSIVQGLCTTVEEAKRQITHVDRNCSLATVADIVFLVDGSTSINAIDFKEVQMFLRRFIEGLDIGSDKVRVGLAQKKDKKPSNMAGTQGFLAMFTIAVCFLLSGAQETECHTVADIVFLVDGSTSISPIDFQEVQMFLRRFIEGLDIGSDKVRVGLAQFSDEPKKEFLLADNTEKSSLLEKVEQLQQLHGGTATGTAISFLQTEFFTKAAGSRADQRMPQIAVVLTDGDSLDDVVIPANELRKHGVLVYAIGVGEVDVGQIKAIANRPSKHFLNTLNNFQELQTLVQRLLKTVCVSMENRKIALFQKFADIFFMVDSNMTPTDFQQVRLLLIELANQLNPSSDTHRLGLAQFSQDTKVEFRLNTYKTKDEYVATFKKLKLRSSGGRHLGAALRHARAEFFTSSNGGRAEKGSFWSQ